MGREYYFDNSIKSISYFFNKNTFITYKRRGLPLKKQLKNIKVGEFDPKNPNYADVLILQAIPDDVNVFNDILNKKYSKYVVYDHSDDLGGVINPPFIRKTIWKVLSFLKREKHIVFQRKELVEKSDLIVCGSKMQAETAKRANHKISHIVDCVPKEEYPLLYDLSIQKSYNEVPTIVWEGTNTSMHQIREVLEVLITLQKTHKFTFIILSNRYNKKDEDFISYLKNKGLNFTFVEWNLENFKETLAKADIAIAPIDVTKKFNRAKPYNKIISYWAYKLPVIASSIQSYKEIVEQGADGFICKNQGEWIASLSALLTDMSLRKKMGEKGWQKAKECSEENFAKKYLEILNENFCKNS